MKASEFCRKWIKEPTRDRRNGNIFAQGGTLYSYGTHYPLARVHGHLLLVNSTPYSVSTARHQIRARSAGLNAGLTVVTVPVPDVIGSVDARYNSDCLKGEARALREKASRARKHKQQYLDYAKRVDDMLEAHDSYFNI